MKAGCKIRVFARYGNEDYVVEEFRHCLGVFQSPQHRTAGRFTPLCDLYGPGPDSKQDYIPNFGEYTTNEVPAWGDLPADERKRLMVSRTPDGTVIAHVGYAWAFPDTVILKRVVTDKDPDNRREYVSAVEVNALRDALKADHRRVEELEAALERIEARTRKYFRGAAGASHKIALESLKQEEG